MKTLVLSTITIVAFSSFALAAHPCDDGTAPEGWQRDGGYCDLRNGDGLKGTGNAGLDPMSDIYFPCADGDCDN
jgi:hypothetical protein